eukprot:NODE_4792_length_764_cov_7.875524_g3996_i0.p1 GENE.NODE_4792_length_764_cov_7.875524_g3996_i0~~NODE_4792_length_764_cov_7.875524_g3996_i0.p1  ORF type:complete len:86 (-),score=2.03 NODE_4792_length_764_cov_7.875524_g3996_i0:346-603(-)
MVQGQPQIMPRFSIEGQELVRLTVGNVLKKSGLQWCRLHLHAGQVVGAYCPCVSFCPGTCHILRREFRPRRAFFLCSFLLLICMC